MTNNTNKWMEFSIEYAQLMNENFSVMNKFWNATMEQQSGHTRKNMEMFFEHMNRNAEIMHEIYTHLYMRSLKEKENKMYQFYKTKGKLVLPERKGPDSGNTDFRS